MSTYHCAKSGLLKQYAMRPKLINSYLLIKFQDGNVKHLSRDEFQNEHLESLGECVREFEKQTIDYRELNNDYESILANDIRGLYASYYLMNSEKRKITQNKVISLAEKVKQMLKPVLSSFTNIGNYNFNSTSNVYKTRSMKSAESVKSGNANSILLDVAKILIFIFMFFVHHSISGLSFVYKFMIINTSFEQSLVYLFFMQMFGYFRFILSVLHSFCEICLNLRLNVRN